jgi:hypothetical protein
MLAALRTKLGERNFALHQLLVFASVVIAALADAAAKLYLIFVALGI